jgi:uncharacterized membrane protein YkoI
MLALRHPPRFLAIALALAALTLPAAAADTPHRACLNKEAQRAAVAANQAIPLAEALRQIQPRHKGDIVRARLCRGQNGLVYMLTLLGRSGKVMRVTVDANNGSVISGR